MWQAAAVLEPSVVHDLANRLREAGYGYDAVAERLGPEGLDGLARNATIPADRALAGAADPQATLIRAFALQQEVRAVDLGAALGELDPLAPILTGDTPDAVRAAIEIRPYAFTDVHGEHSGWLASDLTPTLDGRLGVPRDDFVLGLSPASVTLAQLTIRSPRTRALDLGAGCGIQSVHLATHTGTVVATDLNPRACALTALTAALNGIELDVRQGSLYGPVADERFDLIVTNPPYVMAPPDASRLVYREGSFTADGLVRAVVTGAARHLSPGGALQVLGNWAITADQPWQDRLASWIAPTGCDALVLQRERLDPYEYIEIWLADAGLTGTPEYAARYAEWADYFSTLGIVGVGMGWLTLYHTGHADPELRFDDWPHQVHAGLGDAFAEFPDAARAAGIGDDQLLTTALTLDPSVTSEALGRPGAADPEHLVFRRSTGFGRAVEVDTALAGVVGACDGELPLGVLIEAVADLLDRDAADLRADLLPRLRPLIADGYLR
jgi:methylase of polypeptide subunit release factors